MGVDLPQPFDMLVFYRGLHCPICIVYLSELNRLLPEFTERGVNVLAIILVPVFAVGALIAVQRGARSLRTWGVATAMFAALSLSA